jgi:sec-independent protein translocase protein TatC
MTAAAPTVPKPATEPPDEPGVAGPPGPDTSRASHEPMAPGEQIVAVVAPPAVDPVVDGTAIAPAPIAPAAIAPTAIAPAAIAPAAIPPAATAPALAAPAAAAPPSPPGPPASSPTPDAAAAPADGPTEDARMTIWEHLEELRRRIIKAAIAVVTTTLLGWAFRTQILSWLVAPYQRAWQFRFHKDLVLQTLAPADAFLGYFELSLMTGIVLSAPIIFYQLWSFISPGLYRKEKKLVVPFVLSSSTLFLSGVAFAYYVAFPFTFSYFLSLHGEVRQGVELAQIVTLEFFLDFSTRFLLAFGAVFELPLFIAFLVLANVVTPAQLLKFGRWATVLAFVVGAVITPGPEVTSQLAVSAALVGLYFLSIPIAFMLKPAIGKTEPPAA